jgi:flagellar protein FlgJ
MIAAIGTEAAATRESARLQKACEQFEAVFMNELLKTMRATVAREGLLDGDSGEETFTAMLDEHIAELGAAGRTGGIAAALYQQLRSELKSAR